MYFITSSKAIFRQKFNQKWSVLPYICMRKKKLNMGLNKVIYLSFHVLSAESQTSYTNVSANLRKNIKVFRDIHHGLVRRWFLKNEAKKSHVTVPLNKKWGSNCVPHLFVPGTTASGYLLINFTCVLTYIVNIYLYQTRRLYVQNFPWIVRSVPGSGEMLGFNSGGGKRSHSVEPGSLSRNWRVFLKLLPLLPPPSPPTSY